MCMVRLGLLQGLFSCGDFRCSGVNTPDTSIAVAIVEVNYRMSSLVNSIVLLNKLLFNNRMIPCTR
jgi:hypothetical protein